MKIRAITLKNVRRFQGTTARISGLADGITTICAPNESGKSTFFDALHAIFFYPHSGQPLEVRSLQPHSKGAVEISVDVEDDDGNPFRIEKRYMASKSATITDLATDRLIAQADEAEQWIKTLIGADAHGPAGLLWVRQGISGFGPDGSGAREKGEREKLREARQTLMSSVAGQIDNVTGGRRMDQIMKACEADLDALATRTGQPKAGGEWNKAVKRVEDLEAEETRLASQVSELGQALREHAQIKAAHKASENPDAAAKRDQAIKSAQKALEDAQGHARHIVERQRDLRLAELEAKACKDRIDADAAAGALRKRLETAEKVTKDAAKVTGVDAEKAKKAHEKATLDLRDVRSHLKSARDTLSAARKRLDRRQKAQERKNLVALLAKVDAFEKARKAHAATLRDIRITQKDLDRLNTLTQNLVTTKALREAGAATLQVSYAGQTVLMDADQPLPENEEIPLLRDMNIELPGIGSMKLAPARIAGSSDAEDPDDIAAQISTLLSDLELDGMEAARFEMRRRTDAEREELLARQSIETLVPDGTEQLRRDLDDIEEDDADDEGEVIDVDDLQSRVSAAEEKERIAADYQDETRLAHEAAAGLATAARTKHSLALEALEAPAAAELSAQEHAEMEKSLEAAQGTVSRIKADIEELQKEAPDTEAAEALVARLASARDNATKERERRLERLNILGGVIRARADDGVETRLEETRGKLEKARSRAERYKFEVEALSELRGHLETSRKQAHDAYFEPVKKEIGPLLSMLHDDAAVEMDPDTMLPIKIVRDGIAEKIDTLSGGASEQIAILTRLAFAKLYSRAGKKVPVILDDALVYSDDDRIVKMFTALTRSAKDQQIIVLSCRTRAFEELGGTRATIEIPDQMA